MWNLQVRAASAFSLNQDARMNRAPEVKGKEEGGLSMQIGRFPGKS